MDKNDNGGLSATAHGIRPANSTEYDLPAETAALLEEARRLERLEQGARAARIYEGILRQHPSLTQVRASLARAYEAADKPEKSISVWEELCAWEPDSAEYALELALSLDARGWHKRAVEQYRRSLALDDSDPVCWLSLLHCYLNARSFEDAMSVCIEGVRALRGHNRESIRLHTYAVVFSMRDNPDAAEEYLKEIVRMAPHLADQDDPGEDPQAALNLLLEAALQNRVPKFIPYIRQIGASLERMDSFLRARLDAAVCFERAGPLIAEGYSNLFLELFATLGGDRDCDEFLLELNAIEFRFLTDRDILRPEVSRLQEEYPSLYALHADFFQEAMQVRDPRKMMAQRLKFLAKNGGLPTAPNDQDGISLLAPPETVRRAQDKVGRNDPCPCGSGKKYKKCCGR